MSKKGRKETHVVPNKDGGWDVKQKKTKKASKHFDKKQDAIDYGRDLSKKRKSEFIIHGKDGKIQDSDSHGHDPFPPKG